MRYRVENLGTLNKRQLDGAKNVSKVKIEKMLYTLKKLMACDFLVFSIKKYNMYKYLNN